MNYFSLCGFKIPLLLIMLLLFPITLYTQTEWQIPLCISCDDWQITLHFGVHPNGSDSFDAGLDTLSPPPGFGPYAYFRIESFPNYLTTDIRKTQESASWRLQTVNCSNKIQMLKWDLSQFNASNGETATLKIIGYTDMTEAESLLVEGDITAEIEFTTSTAAVWYDSDIHTDNEKRFNAFPNPFNSSVSFVTVMPNHGQASLYIYDITGKLISTVFNGVLAAGYYKFDWSGTDSYGNKVSTGAYFCRTLLENQVIQSKILMMR